MKSGGRQFRKGRSVVSIGDVSLEERKLQVTFCCRNWDETGGLDLQ